MIQREYYNLWDAGRIAKCKADDILHLGSVGNLPIYALVANLPLVLADARGETTNGESYVSRLTTSGPVRLWQIDLARIEASDWAECSFVDLVRSSDEYRTYQVVRPLSNVSSTLHLRQHNLVVMRADLDNLLAKENSNVSEIVTAKPISRADAQRDAILSAIRERGLNPLKLVKTPNGKSGLKKELRIQLRASRKDVFQSDSVFDDAWQSARNAGDIGELE